MATVLKAKRPTRATDIIVTEVSAAVVSRDRDSYDVVHVARARQRQYTPLAMLRELLPRPFVCKCGTIG
jgi:hypothetical protein